MNPEKPPSPLQKLSQLCETTLATKVKPKLRQVEEIKEIKEVEILDGFPLEIEEDAQVRVNNIVLNLNLSLNSKAVKEMGEQSEKLVKGLAAGAAMAVLGTAALFLNNDKKLEKIKIPLMPKVKIPPLDQCK